MSEDVVLERVRAALGRSAGEGVSQPPTIPEPIARLVSSDVGLGDLFVAQAKAAALDAREVRVDDLVDTIVDICRDEGVSRLATSAGALLTKLGVTEALIERGIDARPWPEMTLDALYDVDASLTDVWLAVAETGSLVMKPREGHGRSLSLTPPMHIAVVEPKQIVPDLIDVFARLKDERDPQTNRPANVAFITGPSKTADIEMNLVRGVHGPATVHVLLLA